MFLFVVYVPLFHRYWGIDISMKKKQKKTKMWLRFYIVAP